MPWFTASQRSHALRGGGGGDPSVSPAAWHPSLRAGEAFEDPDVCEKVLDNLALLHALRVRVVAVLGCFPQMQQRLSARGTTSQFHGGYRITDPSALVAAMESAGMVRSLAEARLSKGPSVKMVRRHQRTMQAFHFRPEVQVSSGNFVVAKRRGIVDGVDFGQTGEVRRAVAGRLRHTGV